MSRPPTTGSLVFVVLVCWFSLVFGLGLTGRLEDPPRPLIPILLAGIVTGLWLASRRIPSVRAWLASLDIRALIGLHVVRWPIGIWFLHQYQRGALPGELALLAGWGDITTGMLAVVMLAFDEHRALGRRALAVFSVIGLVDILAVVVTAQKLLLTDTSIVVGYPFVLLPLFVVPLVIVAHAWAFVRLASAARSEQVTLQRSPA